MKIVTVVGARPQFIKAAVVSHLLQSKHTEVLVHTGQHYDYNMSEQFFKELDIPRPQYNLGISGGTHAQMTGRMMVAIENVLMKERPDMVLLYGDTNSTLAGALVAAKLGIPICHVEAGVRTHSGTNPEEANRVCTDHLSALLLTSTQSGMDNLISENLGAKGHLVGDPMYDAFLQNRLKTEKAKKWLVSLDGAECEIPREFYYLTCHREENANNDKNLFEIFLAMNQLDAPTVYPVHPRNKERAKRLQRQYGFDLLLLTEPVGYLESLFLVTHAKKVVTDSGGLQREAFFAEKQCVTVLDFVCWPETMVNKRNQLARPEAEDIVKKLRLQQKINTEYYPFGDGHSAKNIVTALEKYQKKGIRY